VLKFYPYAYSNTLLPELGHKVYRNGKELKSLQPSNDFTGGDKVFSLSMTKEFISFVLYSEEVNLTPKEEMQVYNFFMYGKTNVSKIDKLNVEIATKENELKNLKNQLRRELK